MTHTDTDHDNDGILSIFEDIDGDNKPFGDDSDGDNLRLSPSESVSYTHLTLPTN